MLSSLDVALKQAAHRPHQHARRKPRRHSGQRPSRCEYPITLGRLEGHGRRGKALSADYVLEFRNMKLAVVEAKARDLPLTEGVGQAKDYADKLKIRWAYSTNGLGVYQVDMGLALRLMGGM